MSTSEIHLAAIVIGSAAIAGCSGGAGARDRALEHALDRAVADGLDVRLDGEGSTWRATLVLPAGAGKLGELPLGREVHAPLGAEVRFALASRDFICEFSLPELAARDFAAPELPGQLRVRPPHAGRYELRGDEMCGLPHGELARGVLVVEDHASWKAWVVARQRAAARETRAR
jgi:heme/copper-type cytochrome/quinol oxidase subunit 2